MHESKIARQRGNEFATFQYESNHRMNREEAFDRDLVNSLSVGLGRRLFAENSVDLIQIYNTVWDNFSYEDRERDLPDLKIEQCALSALLSTKRGIRNIGIDLPIWFGRFSDEQPRIMIVAMDPKRNGQAHKRITLNTVFSLHSKRNGRETGRNDYWKFIQPMTTKSFVYVTDAYKMYYEYDGVKKSTLSNKDKEYIGMSSAARRMNKDIIEWEFEVVKPTYVVALGNEAASAVRDLRSINGSELHVKDDTTEYLFMPHISRTVTQSIVTVANLFSTLGILKNDQEMHRLGDSIKEARMRMYQ